MALRVGDEGNLGGWPRREKVEEDGPGGGVDGSSVEGKIGRKLWGGGGEQEERNVEGLGSDGGRGVELRGEGDDRGMAVLRGGGGGLRRRRPEAAAA